MQDLNKSKYYRIAILLMVVVMALLTHLFVFPFIGNRAAATSPKTALGASKRSIMENYANLKLKRLKVAEIKAKQSATSNVQSFTAEISAYTAVETCGSTCTMANGQQAYYGSVACPRRIPLGTIINIDGLGVFTCSDRTAYWTDGRFDVFFGYTQADYARAKQWGVRVKEVTINHSL